MLVIPDTMVPLTRFREKLASMSNCTYNEDFLLNLIFQSTKITSGVLQCDTTDSPLTQYIDRLLANKRESLAITASDAIKMKEASHTLINSVNRVLNQCLIKLSDYTTITFTTLVNMDLQLKLE